MRRVAQLSLLLPLTAAPAVFAAAPIGKEVAVPRHLQDGEEYTVSLEQLLAHGRTLFAAVWTGEEGGGRPLTKGNGAPLKDPSSPLVFPRNFNRVSAPDANSCAGCHNQPFGIEGGGGDIVANVFVLGQRFDFLTFDLTDGNKTRGATDENGDLVKLQTAANSRNTLGMFGSGFIEMLARQMTADLQTVRNTVAPGQSKALASKGVSFGTLSRTAGGAWVTAAVTGLSTPSLATGGPADPPTLVIRPFHQAGAVVSLREFTNNAFNHHHGIQSTERFGTGTDPDGDGFVNEMTRADVTAAAIFQATLPVPGRIIPNDPEVEDAVRRGEDLFVSAGCVSCHVPSLPLDKQGWIYVEPNPYNPPGNLRPGDAPPLAVDLTGSGLAGPRPPVTPKGPKSAGVVRVPAFTDLRVHDIGGIPEPLDMTKPGGSAAFFAGNTRFITRKLWGTANEPPFWHTGQLTTLRSAVMTHAGEAATAQANFVAMSSADRDALIEFLKTLQVLPPGAKGPVVDERGHKKEWREFPWP